MRTNLGLAMTCMVNSTALLLKNIDNGTLDQFDVDNGAGNATLLSAIHVEKTVETNSTCTINQMTKGKAIVNDYGVNF